ncbi:MAG: permease-like cell division protein FtsX [Firmicutes bacterium]|nr:permease-like cell division protein FtsX [Bacillota bacterium]
MNLKKIGYFLKQAFKNMARNKVMSFSTILTVAISLLIVGTFVVFIVNAGIFIETQSNKTQLSVFVDTAYTTAEAKKVGTELEKIPGIATIDYKSKEDALKEMIDKQGGESGLESILGDENPMPHTFIITGKTNLELESISASAKKIEGVYKVDYAKDLADKLTSIVNAVRVGGIVAVGILFLIALFLISTTIKLSLYAKRKEIQVMKYVGSSNSFIQGPFLASGMLLGFLGALFASIILFVAYKFLMDWAKNVEFLNLTFQGGQIAGIIAALLVSGILVGAFGSYLSLRKYLEV